MKARLLQQPQRRGTILPMVAIGLVGLVGFVALAIDISVIAVVRNQCQNAADVGAMTGARSLNGSVNANLPAAEVNARNAAKSNKVMSNSVEDTEVVVQFGAYHYDPNTFTFEPQYPPVPPDTYNLTKVTVTRRQPSLFAGVFGFTGFDVSAVSVGAHRPRDVCMVLDYSGSMNNESDLWNNEGYLGSANNSPNNTDPVVPTFGPYSSPNATMVCASGDARVGKCNITQWVLGIPSLMEDFYSNDRGDSATGAFEPAPNDLGETPGGDNFLKTVQNTSSTWAQTANQVVASVDRDRGFERDGYATFSNLTGMTDYSNSPFFGYTEGPKIFGKTFMIWPPDPRAGPIPASQSASKLPGFLQDLGYTVTQTTTGTSTSQKKIQGIYKVVAGITGSRNWPWPDATSLSDYLLSNVRQPGSGTQPLLTMDHAAYQAIMRLHNRPLGDWRARFFLKADGVTPVDDNTLLWDSNGNWRAPVVSGTTNYKINYAAILNWIKNTGPNAFPPNHLRAGRILYYDSIPNDVPASAYTWTNANSQIVDPTVRFWKEYIDYTLGVWRDPYGNIQTPGNPACSYGPDFTFGTISVTAKPTTPPSGHPIPSYMNYADNPKRPRHRGWFGPMTMIQFISDTGQLPGTAHDISMYPAKLGIHSAIIDISNNHPNDLVSLLMYNRPHYNSDPVEVGTFTNPQYSLSRDYAGMQSALYYPPNSSNNDVRPWDPNAIQTPRAFGDYTSNTATSYGMMQAYNQFSQNSSLRASGLGGHGRKGAQRLVVLETDGLANIHTNATFVNNGPYNSFYDTSSLTVTTSNVSAGVIGVVNQICAMDSANGYSTSRKPVIIHCVAFGAVFEPTAAGTDPANAMTLLRDISTIGRTGFPASVTDTGHPDFYKLCTGTLQQREDKLRQAFSRIMDDGLAVSLIN
jgi:hypothetical protein